MAGSPELLGFSGMARSMHNDFCKSSLAKHKHSSFCHEIDIEKRLDRFGGDVIQYLNHKPIDGEWLASTLSS